MTTPIPAISIIAAVTTDLALGRNGDLLYRLKPDMRHFREITMGHPIVMGRRTFESFPKGALPGRRNIVITRNPDYRPAGAETYPTLSQALKAAGAGGDEVFVIGGGQIYALAMPLATRLYLTEIKALVPDADTFFPAVDPTEWKPESVGEWTTDPDADVSYRFVCLTRR